MKENFRTAVDVYMDRGWSVAPSQPGIDSKKPALKGAFGRSGNISEEQMRDWQISFADRNCLLRLSKGVIGIDIDDYWKAGVRKRGGQTIARWESRYGGLPATFTSTSRGGGQPSRIMFYSLSEHSELVSVLEPGGDVEIIQNHHRYAVVWPSIHPETGTQYQWFDPNGLQCSPPRVQDLTALPEEWRLALVKSAGSSSAGKPIYEGDTTEWFEAFDEGTPSDLVNQFIEEFKMRPNAHVGHDELLYWISKAHNLQFRYHQSGAREFLDLVIKTYLATTGDPKPEVELVNIVRWIIGQDWSN
jgi:hypothetical protein